MFSYSEGHFCHPGMQTAKMFTEADGMQPLTGAGTALVVLAVCRESGKGGLSEGCWAGVFSVEEAPS